MAEKMSVFFVMCKIPFSIWGGQHLAEGGDNHQMQEVHRAEVHKPEEVPGEEVASPGEEAELPNDSLVRQPALTAYFWNYFRQKNHCRCSREEGVVHYEHPNATVGCCLRAYRYEN